MKHDALSPFVAAPEAVKMVQSKKSYEWERIREDNAIKLFQTAAQRVPAYMQYLKEKKINPDQIASWEDFQAVPIMSKAAYLRKYPLSDLCWDGTLARPGVFAATSGSTGKPFYFQRSQNLEEEYSAIVEMFLSQGEHPPSPEYPTLVIIGFGMGIWIGGMLTYRAYEIASQRGYPVSILPAGVNMPEIIAALKELAPQFKQTIIIGYPPFVKDILDEAELEGIDLASLNIRLQFAAEAFTEQFRDHLGKKAGIKNVLRDTLNVYGTADIGAMAFETPTAILIRRLALQNENLFKRLFGDVTKIPTLVQYNPAYMTFETNIDDEVLLTGNSAIPLIRYAVGDHGGVHSYDEIKEILEKEGVSFEEEAKKYDVPLCELPFVYVYARSDLSTKLYGAIIYPEHIKYAFEEEAVSELTTGKFTIQTLTDEQHNEYLELNVELKRNIQPSEEVIDLIRDRVIAHLLEKNSEYAYLYGLTRERVTPHVILYENGDATYFKPGVKQKWVIKAPSA